MSISRSSCRLLPLALSSRSNGALLQRGNSRELSALTCPRAPTPPAVQTTNQQLHLDFRRKLHLSPLQGSKNPGALSRVGSYSSQFGLADIFLWPQVEEEELVPERLYSRVVIKVWPCSPCSTVMMDYSGKKKRDYSGPSLIQIAWDQSSFKLVKVSD